MRASITTILHSARLSFDAVFVILFLLCLGFVGLALSGHQSNTHHARSGQGQQSKHRHVGVVAGLGDVGRAAALMALAGIMDAKEANERCLAVDGAKGFSTFYGYYMLRAMALAGNYQGALDVIRTYWGAMLDVGATTFWEDFNMEWLPDAGRIDELVPAGKKDIHGDYGAYCYQGFRHSLCHGWASGPTSWLSEYVLGVQVVEPGCRTVRIIPHLGDLEWVEGTFPTPYGVIEIRHEKGADGRVISHINAPEEIRVNP